MRRVGLTDLHHAARALCAVPYERRSTFCARLIWQAHVADKYVKRLRRLHPQWGDGSLRAVALTYAPPPVPPPDTADLLACMSVAIKALQVPAKLRHSDIMCERVCMRRNCAK